jgi:uncharacterized membrane protein
MTPICLRFTGNVHDYKGLQSNSASLCCRWQGSVTSVHRAYVACPAFHTVLKTGFGIYAAAYIVDCRCLLFAAAVACLQDWQVLRIASSCCAVLNTLVLCAAAIAHCLLLLRTVCCCCCQLAACRTGRSRLAAASGHSSCGSLCACE